MKWAVFARDFVFRTKNGRWSFRAGQRRLAPEVIVTAADRAGVLAAAVVDGDAVSRRG